MLRTFIAIPISAPTRNSLRAAQQALVAQGFRARWTKPDQFHITLKFLGEIPAPMVESVAEATEAAIRGWRPFTLSFAGVGAFPDWARPRVLWAGVAAGQSALTALAGDVDAALASLGFAREERPFQAHVTLGRIQQGALQGAPKGAPPKVALAAGPERVGRVVVYESRLTPAGAIYAERHSFTLEEA